MKLAPAVILPFVLAALAGCGGEESGSPEPTPPGVTGGAFADVPLPPQGPEPEGPGQDGPPPAWISTPTGSSWLGFATYCWGTMCADYIAPRCGEPHVPDVVVAEGDEVTFHLDFEPTSASLLFFGEVVEGEGGPEQVRLDPAKGLRWTVDREGPVWLSTDTADGDASYSACLRFEAGGEETLTVPQALARGDGPAAVTGTIYAEGGDVRLCDALAESFPPQCPGDSLRLEGFDLASAAGLSREGGVAWGDRPTTLRGTLRDSTLILAE